MLICDARQQANWLALTLEAVKVEGFAVVQSVLSPDFLETTRSALYEAQAAVHQEVGVERLKRAGELGVMRLCFKHHPHFYRFLELPELLAVVDHTVSETAILHTQNGFILPTFPVGQSPPVFQNRFHMDFPRVLNGYLASINVFFAIDEFTAENGATLVVPGSHQKPSAPSEDYMKRHGVPLLCPAGSMVVFDSTLWHAAGANTSGADRLAINHQFTRSWIKQQIDYVRALGDDAIRPLQPRTQQILGWYTRVVTCLDEYYRPEAERLYRRGQG